MKKFNFIIITGFSGSGKSTALAALEDIGFYCVDNMPVALLPKFFEISLEPTAGSKGLAFVMDLREKGFLSGYREVLADLRKKGFRFQILFLETAEETLVQRYSQTRRQHPLSAGRTLRDGIAAEKKILSALRRDADAVIDTTRFNVHELKAVIQARALKDGYPKTMQISVLSFGFKFGIPIDADLIMDVRFLQNPFFVPELRDLDGEIEEVRRFVFQQRDTEEFLAKYFNLLDFLIPRYFKEGKAYLTIAVGCTGGRHRSVTIARALYDRIKEMQHPASLTHRDIQQQGSL
ncbi:MAG: RNase adapter RapZ [Desulfobacterales bacterium]